MVAGGFYWDHGGFNFAHNGIITFFAKAHYCRYLRLVAILAVFGLTLFIPGSRDIKDILIMLTGEAKIDSSLPGLTDLSMVPWGDWSFLPSAVAISLTIAMVGLIESLLTLR